MATLTSFNRKVISVVSKPQNRQRIKTLTSVDEGLELDNEHTNFLFDDTDEWIIGRERMHCKETSRLVAFTAVEGIFLGSESLCVHILAQGTRSHAWSYVLQRAYRLHLKHRLHPQVTVLQHADFVIWRRNYTQPAMKNIILQISHGSFSLMHVVRAIAWVKVEQLGACARKAVRLFLMRTRSTTGGY
ncbi:hypothetical protein DEU56DRAFT_755793 [Suillus clintonianus]|uniref:uncharacterized protein n=1 Tax=Suillus clintonianus TaxID=1904413 RepID=UPI001B860784|nr:uncharacterized protein DEU56DRAFT_755793 [Suillus clintonianus]KAG2138491.1 hypothetical protein DEU56DRAFT_755793 [Suillus clintonianus]